MKIGNEHSEIPISMKVPEDWYNYEERKWANIVVRNEGKETYLVWIPRYQYMIRPSQTVGQEEAEIVFIPKNKTEASPGYNIPEAFVWSDIEADTAADKQIAGFWTTKYEVAGIETGIEADITTTNTSVKVSNIRKPTETNMKVEYWIDGEKRHETTNKEEGYEYTGLEQNKKYTVTIIVRNSITDAHIAALTKEVTTRGPNAPDLTGFNEGTTFYLTWDAGGNEVRTPITGAQPENWYNYGKKEWANIVTTSEDRTKETYLVWIPRYAYLALDNQYVDILWLPDTSQDVPEGYNIPEAFIWSDTEGDTEQSKQIRGFWTTKYEVNNI